MKLLPSSWILYAVLVSQKGQNKARNGTEKGSMDDQRYRRVLVQGRVQVHQGSSALEKMTNEEESGRGGFKSEWHEGRFIISHD